MAPNITNLQEIIGNSGGTETNLSEVIKKLRPLTKKIFDVHLMISPVDNFIKDFANAGADIITFHPEATEDTAKTIDLIRKEEKK